MSGYNNNLEEFLKMVLPFEGDFRIFASQRGYCFYDQITNDPNVLPEGYIKAINDGLLAAAVNEEVKIMSRDRIFIDLNNSLLDFADFQDDMGVIEKRRRIEAIITEAYETMFALQNNSSDDI